MLNLSRRHSSSKCGKTKKRDCTCPIWATGSLHGKRMRKALGVRNWDAAQRLVARWESKQLSSISVSQAFDRYLADCVARGLRLETLRKYQLLAREMTERFGNFPVDAL